MTEHRSASQLNTYLRCPYAYKLKYVDHQPGVPATWLIVGSAAHDALEKWELSGRTTDIRADFDIFLDQYIETSKIVEPNQSRWTRARGKDTSADLVKRADEVRCGLYQYVRDAMGAAWRPVEVDGRPAVEVELTVDLGGVPVVCKIDLLIRWDTGLLTVRDYKTGNKVADTHQLGLYKVATENQLGLTISDGEFWYLKDNKGTWTPRAKWNSYTTEYMIGIYQQLDRAVRSEIFLPNPDNCSRCDQRWNCTERNF